MPTKDPTAIQEEYPESLQHCYGCGVLNAEGLQLKSFRAGQHVVARFEADPKYLGIPGFAYGGLIASLIDCHAMATAAAYFKDRRTDSTAAPRTVTAALDVRYLRPTPLGDDALELSARVIESSERKAVVDVDLGVGGKTTATGQVVAVLLPEDMAAQSQEFT